MAKLYVANTTKQTLNLSYRMIERENMAAKNRAYELRLPPGHGDFIPFDLQTEDIDFIVKQWTIFGVVAHNDVKRETGWIGVCYRIDKPVSEDAINAGVAQNDAMMQKRSEQVFAEAGVALADVVSKRAREQGSNLVKTEVSVQQDFDGPVPKGVISRGVSIERQAGRV